MWHEIEEHTPLQKFLEIRMIRHRIAPQARHQVENERRQDLANRVVYARAQNVEIGFWEYFTVGAPLTVLTIGIGVLWLEFV
jgi:hypothetical protein